MNAPAEFFDDRPTPMEEDAYVADAGSRGYSASVDGKHLGVTDDLDAAVRMVAAETAAQGYCPAVWHVNDHGNVTLLILAEDGGWDFSDVSYV